MRVYVPSSSPLRVFMGPVEIAGYYTALQQGFRELGVQSTFIDLGAHRFHYAGGRDGGMIGLLARTAYGRLAEVRPEDRARQLLWQALAGVTGALLLAWALLHHDVFIFGYRRTFFRCRELPLLRFLGKTVMFTFHGGDSRPFYLDGSLTAEDRGTYIADWIEGVRRQKVELERIKRHANALLDYPLDSHLQERPVVRTTAIGVPRPQTPNPAPGGEGESAELLHVLHSPSHPTAKGTAEIRAAVERARSRGHRIDLREIRNQPNAVVLAELSRCDFVIDQLYSNVPTSGFAAEAAASGKPVIMAGYAGEAVARAIPPEERLPLHYCHPDELDDAIEKLASDPEYRSRLGAEASDFVRRRWSARAVAERYLRVASGDLPPEWMWDPAELRYVHGCGMTEARARRQVREVVELGGVEALQVADKPGLERRLLEFAYGERDAAAPAPEPTA